MAETSPKSLVPRLPSRPQLAARAAVALVLTGVLLGAVSLWAHYGTTVFFETIRAGLSACFG
jgi:hypothetical protein